MTTTTSDAFSPTEALRFGWDTATANLKVLLPIGAAGAILALLQGALERSPGGWLPGLGLQILRAGVTLALLRTCLRLKDGQPIGAWNLHDLLAGFLPFLLANVLYGVIVAGGLVLLIVPGILWAIEYGFAPLVVVDQHARDPIDALCESKRLTAGRKWPLFKLGLLLIATNLLGALALGVGLLITIPTTMLAAVHVFRRLQSHGASHPSAPMVPLEVHR